MAFQGLFRRNNEFVVVKPVHLTANETLEVGTVIDMAKGNVKWFQLRLWFRRRRIGTKDTDWVNQILNGARRPEGAAINTKRDIANLAKTLGEVAKQKAEDHPPLIGLETEEGAKELESAKAADSTVEPSDEQETASTEPEVDVAALEADAEREQKEADEAKEKLARARKDAKNKRERERRAAKKAGK